MIEQFFNKSILNIDQQLKELVDNTKYVDIIDEHISNIENEYQNMINEINRLNIGFYNQNYQNINSLKILQKELKIIKLLSKYSLQENIMDTGFLLKCLKLLLELSEILRERLKQKEIKINKNNLHRSSYKFCNFKEKCSYNYTKKRNYCYQDHYVHNMVSYDIKVLINFIENNDITSNNKEILKSINTISFVINHMESELNAKCMYLEESEWESFHIINNYKK